MRKRELTAYEELLQKTKIKDKDTILRWRKEKCDCRFYRYEKGLS